MENEGKRSDLEDNLSSSSTKAMHETISNESGPSHLRLIRRLPQAIPSSNFLSTPEDVREIAAYPHSQNNTLDLDFGQTIYIGCTFRLPWQQKTSDFRTDVIQSQPSSSERTVVNHNLSIYSQHIQAYIKGLKGKETFKNKIDTLKEFLKAAEDQLTENENKQLEEFKDPITFKYMTIPVFLNDKFYDLSTLEKMNNKDPFSKEKFNLSEIQSGRILIDKFNQVIEKIEQNHPALKEKFEGQNVFRSLKK
jgi:hypothetical protein